MSDNYRTFSFIFEDWHRECSAMRWKVMAIFDAAVESYSPPFCVRAVGEAIRGFTQEVRSEKSRMSQSPKDYTLFEIGDYDDTSGLVVPLGTPRKIVSGNEVDSFS